MANLDKVLERILNGRADNNITFDDLCNVLARLGFGERIKGDHHVFTEEGQKAPVFHAGNEWPPTPKTNKTATTHSRACEFSTRRHASAFG